MTLWLTSYSKILNDPMERPRLVYSSGVNPPSKVSSKLRPMKYLNNDKMDQNMGWNVPKGGKRGRRRERKRKAIGWVKYGRFSLVWGIDFCVSSSWFGLMGLDF